MSFFFYFFYSFYLYPIVFSCMHRIYNFGMFDLSIYLFLSLCVSNFFIYLNLCFPIFNTVPSTLFISAVFPAAALMFQFGEFRVCVCLNCVRIRSYAFEIRLNFSLLSSLVYVLLSSHLSGWN